MLNDTHGFLFINKRLGQSHNKIGKKMVQSTLKFCKIKPIKKGKQQKIKGKEKKNKNTRKMFHKKRETECFKISGKGILGKNMHRKYRQNSLKKARMRAKQGILAAIWLKMFHDKQFKNKINIKLKCGEME